ncbi:MAG: hypothetical protein ACJAYR_002326 [Sneathiella sp.]|jgi:hypothetical protein
MAINLTKSSDNSTALPFIKGGKLETYRNKPASNPSRQTRK